MAVRSSGIRRFPAVDHHLRRVHVLELVGRKGQRESGDFLRLCHAVRRRDVGLGPDRRSRFSHRIPSVEHPGYPADQLGVGRAGDQRVDANIGSG